MMADGGPLSTGAVADAWRRAAVLDPEAFVRGLERRCAALEKRLTAVRRSKATFGSSSTTTGRLDPSSSPIAFSALNDFPVAKRRTMGVATPMLHSVLPLAKVPRSEVHLRPKTVVVGAPVAEENKNKKLISLSNRRRTAVASTVLPALRDGGSRGLLVRDDFGDEEKRLERLERRKRERRLAAQKKRDAAWITTGGGVMMIGGSGSSVAAAASETLKRLKEVYAITADERERRDVAASTIAARCRGVYVRARYDASMAWLALLKEQHATVAKPCFEPAAVRCAYADGVVAELRSRRQRKALRGCWKALVCHLVDAQAERDEAAMHMTTLTKGERFLAASVKCADALMKAARVRLKRAVRAWSAAAREITRVQELRDFRELEARLSKLPDPDPRHYESAEAVVEFALTCATRAAKRASHVAQRASQDARRTYLIAMSTFAASDARARVVFGAWKRWAHISVEGRFALVLTLPEDDDNDASRRSDLLGGAAAEEGGFNFARELNTPARVEPMGLGGGGLKAAYFAPYDKKVKVIARTLRQRRCFVAWSQWAFRIGEARLWRRRRLTGVIREMVRRWANLAAALGRGRREAVRRAQAKHEVRLSQPLKAWYVWVRSRVTSTAEADRIISAYLRLKKRATMASVLREWKNSAELKKLKQRYTRRELMNAVSEQKAHLRRLQRLADEHGTARAELELQAANAKSRSLRLGRVAAGLDAECRALKHRLVVVERGVEDAHRLLAAARAVKPSITDHVLKAQPTFGFVDRGLPDLTKEREAERQRRDVGVSSSSSSPPPPPPPPLHEDSNKTQDGDASSIASSFRESDDDAMEASLTTVEGGLNLAATIVPPPSPSRTTKANVFFSKPPPKKKKKKKNKTTLPEGEDEDEVERLEVEVPRGLESVMHPHHTGGMLLCRAKGDAKDAAVVVLAGVDRARVAFELRLDWVIACKASGVITFEECVHVDGAAVNDPSEDERVVKFVPLRGVKHEAINARIADLVPALVEAYALFDFLRQGALNVLPDRLQADWCAFCAARAAQKPSDQRAWRSLTSQTALNGRISTWADLRSSLDARLPSTTRADAMAPKFVEAQRRKDNTYLALYATLAGPKTGDRPNPYSTTQIVRDTFKPQPAQPWSTTR